MARYRVVVTRHPVIHTSHIVNASNVEEAKKKGIEADVADWGGRKWLGEVEVWEIMPGGQEET